MSTTQKGMIGLLSCLLLITIVYLSQTQTPRFLITDPLPQQDTLSGELQFNAVLSSLVNQPGETIVLEVELQNLSSTIQAPQLEITFPFGMIPNLETAVLTGTSYNREQQKLTWHPTPLPPTTQQTLTLPINISAITTLKDPTQEIILTLQNASHQQQKILSTWIGLPINVQQIHAPDQLSVGMPLAIQTDILGSGPIEQQWELGDGRQLFTHNPTIIYPETGVYTLQLTAKNPLNISTNKTIITIVPQPTAKFVTPNNRFTPDTPIHFVNQSGGEQPRTYHWDFGDGTTSTQETPQHTYQQTGLYEVTLTVDNIFGQSTTSQQLIISTQPRVNFDIQLQDPLNYLVGTATNQPNINEYRWDMGDGTIKHGSVITHQYTTAGNYYITLQTSNDHGTAEQGQWVTITPEQATDWSIAPAPEPEGQTQFFAVTPNPDIANQTKTQQLLYYINEARRLHNIPILQTAVPLNRAAQAHTNDMSVFHYTSHTGADGSYPAERLLWHNYQGRYGGEATAWGFRHAYEAVDFWLNSPPHRAIILNRSANQVGVGYTVDFNAPNVWYWTAEFGNQYANAISPEIRIHSFEPEIEILPNQQSTTLAWIWQIPLQQNDKFTIRLINNENEWVLGTVTQPKFGMYYDLTITEWPPISSGEYQWQVQLNNNETTMSEPFTIIDSRPTATPTATPTVTPSPIPNTTVTPTSTTTPRPTLTPKPPTPTPPSLIEDQN